jgi:hypothetical protein
VGIRGGDIHFSDGLIAYFWANVEPYTETGCLLWMGTIEHGARGGYGKIAWQGRVYSAHRVSYCLHHNVVNLPEGFVIDHLCCVRPCVEWSHLEAVTVSVNTLRGRSPQLTRERRLRTHCPKGHALLGDNLIVQQQRKGIRQRCRICKNAYNRVYLRQWHVQHKGGDVEGVTHG